MSYEETLEQITEVREEIKELQERLVVLRGVRDKLQKKLDEGRTGEFRSNDTHFVLIPDIRHTVTRWVELYDQQYGKGGQKMLGERSNVSTRLIRRIVNGDYLDRKFVTLQTADRLLTAVGSDKLNDLIIYSYTEKVRMPDPPPSQYFEE